MSVWIAILCFLNGAALASCFFIAHARRDKKQEPTESEDKEREKFARQWANFLNYDGTDRGQQDYDG